MTKSIRVLVADDHAVVRKGTRAFLEEDDEIAVVGEASDGLEVLALVDECRPDVVLLDVEMPRLSGIAAMREIKARYPEIGVLALTIYEDDAHIFAVLHAGADGYMLKNTGIDELIQAVKKVASGGKVIDPAVADRAAAQQKAGKPASAREQVEPLSERELEILRLAARGITNKGIAVQLGISDRTVQGHLASIYGKLQAGSRTEALTKALTLGWLVLEDS